MKDPSARDTRLLKLCVFVFVVLIVVPSLALAGLCWTRWGRAVVCRKANALVSEAIAGSLNIERIDQLGPHLRVYGVTIADPQGEPVIEVEEVSADLDLSAILAGSFAWHRADVRNGRVRVREDDQGRINMEETFRAAHPSPTTRSASKAEQSPLDLRRIATSGMELEVGGGDMRELKLTRISGIMRVHVLPDDEVSLRFDGYEGDFTEGLPTGRLAFRDVRGHVQSAGDRLLRFEGAGKSEGKEVSFELDIHTEPKTQVEIAARFPELSAESISTLGFAAWTKLVPGLDLQLSHGAP